MNKGLKTCDLSRTSISDVRIIPLYHPTALAFTHVILRMERPLLERGTLVSATYPHDYDDDLMRSKNRILIIRHGKHIHWRLET